MVLIITICLYCKMFKDNMNHLKNTAEISPRIANKEIYFTAMNQIKLTTAYG